MTTIVYRDGVLAADSQVTKSGEDAGAIKLRCQKLFPKKVGGEPVIIATAGDSTPGLLFVKWYGSRKAPPEGLREASIECLVLARTGLWLFDQWCHGEAIDDEFFAIGCGAKAALGALHMGASALQALQIAAKIDPYTSDPFTVLTLEDVT